MAKKGKGRLHSQWIDRTGHTYGFYTVLEFNDDTNKWKVECVCGAIREYSGAAITKERAKSCGCKKNYLNSKNNSKGKDAVWLSIFHSYRSSAKTRDYTFNLDYDEFKNLCQSNCHYCGTEPSNERTRKYIHGSVSIKFNGVDRVNNDLNYITTNCVPCCKTCNLAKHSLTTEEFYAWIKQIIKHNKI